jgi:hypothetical protein
MICSNAVNAQVSSFSDQWRNRKGIQKEYKRKWAALPENGRINPSIIIDK